MTAIRCVLAFLLLAFIAGCGGSAIRIHATTATVALVAITGAGDSIVQATRAALAECSAPGLAGRDECLDRVGRTSEAAAAAVDLVTPLVVGYRDAVVTGAIAGDDPSVIATLSTLLLRILSAWPSMAASLRALGIELPALSLGGGP